jgi:hypothetical protein
MLKKIVIALFLICLLFASVVAFILIYYDDPLELLQVEVEPIKPFEKFNFKQGGYVLIGIDNWGRSDLPNFYIEDPLQLEKLKSSWVFNKTALPIKRVYHYTVVLLKDGEIVKWFPVDRWGNQNPEQGAIRLSVGGLFLFDKKLLDGHELLVSYKQSFNSLDDGRSFIQKTMDEDSFVFSELPKWFYFDGYLEFEQYLTCSGDLEFIDNEASMQSSLASRYGSDQFLLHHLGQILGRIESDSESCQNIDQYALSCNEELAQKFNGYPVTQSWKSYDELKWVYWVKAQESVK